MVKLPDVMKYRAATIRDIGVPEPLRDDLVGIVSAPPTTIAERIAIVGSYLGFLEYHLCLTEAAHLTVKEAFDYAMTVGMASMDPKATIKSKEAQLFATDASLRDANESRVAEAAVVEHIKGLRNAYRAQYDALSRILASKQLEADIAR